MVWVDRIGGSFQLSQSGSVRGARPLRAARAKFSFTSAPSMTRTRFQPCSLTAFATAAVARHAADLDAAARALVEYEDDAEVLCRKAMKIAAEVCVYTNDRLTVETLESAT